MITTGNVQFKFSRKESRSTYKDDELSTEGRFILYTVANTFLSQDYEHCLKICTADFSFVANNNIFEGNIYRFKALVLHEIFKMNSEQGVPISRYALETLDTDKLSDQTRVAGQTWEQLKPEAMKDNYN